MVLQEECYAQGVRNMEFDQYLAPYDLPRYATWQHLSNYITSDVIDHLRKYGQPHHLILLFWVNCTAVCIKNMFAMCMVIWLH